jgi:iron complex transport system substrate-binding protein
VEQPHVTPRIASLLPSATEIACALGFADALVARSHECDFPEEVDELPVCTAPEIDPQGSSQDIHNDVSALLAQSLSVYRVDGALLRELAPTHVLTQVHCEVCAVSLGDVEATLAEWSGERPRVVALSPSSLEEVFEDLERVASSLGVPGRGRALACRLRSRMAEVAARARSLPRPRVATIEWLAPPMTAGNWMPDLVEMAGGQNLFGESGRHSGETSWQEIAASDPDVLAIFPCGFLLPRVEEEIASIAATRTWREFRAVREGRVVAFDGQRFFNRPGPRLAETLEMLAEALHPGAFAPRWENDGFRRLAAIS